ncbi:integrase catalytic domain-containing protein [Trichonephila clavipes]|nr:integrase catalytic domain-containing protein [Trichonephila clavipes]
MGTLYKEFMNEYELLGHMEEIKNETLDKINYYIPHHSVYKPEKTFTPLRVVFDASAKTTSGFSLNSILLNGGIIQQDFFSIVSRFRKHEYAFGADIKKLYRQILVDPNQRDLQRNMWKTSADAPVKTYKLATVTYGTVSAPFLATRTLKALADEEKAEFPDASEGAYAAVVYIKCFNESGQSQTRLLCSKSRVAPLKTLTIPRLELSAALLLLRLVKKVVPILQLPIHKIWMWTDSTIALAWIKTEPHKLKTFVRNRVAEIQALSKDYHWKHVRSKNNPADLISRGCNVDELLKNEMWFSGPDLQTDKYEDYQLFPDPSYRDELKCAVTLSMTECSSNFYDELFNVTNNFIKIIRIFSFIFRFINNIKAKESCNKEKYLTADEIKRSTEFLAKIAQLSEFKAEIDALKKGKGVSKTSKLRALDPFLDENYLLRVGGRLSNADLPFEAKHQIIIPSKHKFTKLLFEHMHKKFFHIGAQGLVHQIRMQFWPINGKGIARKTVHDCIAYFRQKPTGVDQLMGNLPLERVIPSAPFVNSGVDFCGPFQIKFKNQRKGIFSKVYVAIFVCLATKVIHLDAVTDLTTEAFIAALKRLCARRGHISTLMSDNATNFKGAAAELNRFIKLICNKNEILANYFASEAIQWKFIPPRSPNFGGLWEAGQRNKWQFEKNNVAVGCLVPLKENDLPPCKWAMARILEVIYGTDGSLKTESWVFTVATRTSPSLPGYTGRTRSIGHVLGGPSSLINTVSFLFKFGCAFRHFLRGCKEERKSELHFFQKPRLIFCSNYQRSLWLEVEGNSSGTERRTSRVRKCDECRYAFYVRMINV